MASQELNPTDLADYVVPKKPSGLNSETDGGPDTQSDLFSLMKSPREEVKEVSTEEIVEEIVVETTSLQSYEPNLEVRQETLTFDPDGSEPIHTLQSEDRVSELREGESSEKSPPQFPARTDPKVQEVLTTDE